MAGQSSSAVLRAFLIGSVALASVAFIAFLAPRTRPAPDVQEDPFSLPHGQVIDLQVGKKKMKELQRRRDAALAVGILQEDDSSWVKAKLIEGNETWKVRIRLKGDWTDHLEGEKWSFRVEVRDSLRPFWHRLQVFSLQSPDRRGFLNEWLYHQALAREGVLTPYYDFVQLRLNGHDLGVYAVEEHFTKQLVERQQRREGPLVKIDESGMWDARVASLRDSAFPYLQIPFFDAAATLPFQKSHILKDTLLSMQWEDALRLMRQYRADAAPPGSLFDLDLMARQYALTDLFAAYHSLIWHNRRYYFNPIIQRLEPVVFDGFSGPVNDTYISVPFWGYQLHGGSRDDALYRDVTSVMFFRDPDFVREYYRLLERYSQPSYLDSLWTALRPGIAENMKLLRTEYWAATVDTQLIRHNALQIAQTLRAGAQPNQIAVQRIDGGMAGQQLRIWNHNPLPVEIWSDRAALAQPQFLEPDCGQPGQMEAIFLLQPADRLYFRVPGTQATQELDWKR